MYIYRILYIEQKSHCEASNSRGLRDVGTCDLSEVSNKTGSSLVICHIVTVTPPHG